MPETKVDPPKPSVALVERSSIRGWTPERTMPVLAKVMNEACGNPSGTRYYNNLMGTNIFVTSDPSETMNFPANHPMAGHCQWAWSDSKLPGTKLGTRIVYNAPPQLSDDPE